MEPDPAPLLFHQAMIHREQGEMAQAQELLTELLTVCPNHADGWGLQGLLAAERHAWEQALICYQRATTLQPLDAEYWNNLGVAARRLERNRLAERTFHQAVTLDGSRPRYRLHWGHALERLGRLPEAATVFAEGTELFPGDASLWHALGTLRLELGRPEEAIPAFQQALHLRPDFAEAHNNLGVAWKETGQLDQALSCLRQAVAMVPDRADTWNNLGNIAKAMGDLHESGSAYRQALLLAPDHLDAHRNRLQGLLYLDEEDDPASAGRLFQEHLNFGRLYDRPSGPIAFPAIAPFPGRRLRIGYLSADFREHPVARNLLPILEAHDRERFAIWGYAEVARPDRLTERMQRGCDGFRWTVGMSDPEVAELIRQDAMDVLVVLAGRFDRNRPLVVTYRPAPVQVSLHDAATSGLAAMDALITDGYIVPRGSTERFTERIIRLPSFHHHVPLSGAPPLTRPPLTRHPPGSGRLTLASFHNPAKLSEGTLALWAEILLALPQAQLLLKYRNWFGSVGVVARIEAIFSARGVGRSQWRCLPFDQTWEDHLNLYQGVDVALDTLPFSGFTATFEALWMGVPVVTLAGKRMSTRWSGAMLCALGEEGWIADSPGRYRDIVLQLAADPARLALIRAGLRERVARSSLCDVTTRARQLERVYRALWLRWWQRAGAVA